jgi:diacylglycerol kinase (ATP)
MTACNFLRGRIRSIAFASDGVWHLLRTQRNAWVHLAASALVIGGGSLLRLNQSDWCWLIVAMAAVWVAEALNTALELLADAACPQWHPLVGHAKDVAAGGVLLAAIAAAGIGTCVLGPRLSLLLPAH